jgi:hypothetical protein
VGPQEARLVEKRKLFSGLIHAVTTLRKPPDDPEINSMENVWDYLRQNKPSALAWTSHDETAEVCKTAWNWLSVAPARLTSNGSHE